jgi:acetyl esterase
MTDGAPFPVSSEKRLFKTNDSAFGVRFHRPEGTGPLPLFVYFHGGGFVGRTASRHALGADIASVTGAITVCVDYRLAPAHPFPAAHDDCMNAWLYCVKHAASLGGDPARIAMGGDSAGGTISASLTVLAREHRYPQPKFQFLAYPLLAGVADTPARRKFAGDLAPMVAGLKAYAENTDADKDPRLTPLLTQDLSRLPPTMIVTCGRDPLRDEGDMYAKRLRDAGVAVTPLTIEEAYHGFLTSTKHPELRNRVVAQMALAFRAAMG